MRRVGVWLWAITFSTLLEGSSSAAQQRRDNFTEAEIDLLREAQEPAERVKVYVALATARLDRLEEVRRQGEAEHGGTLNWILEGYVRCLDELKDWIELQYDKGSDMRKGLRELLQIGPQHLERLRQVRDHPDRDFADYRDILRDAMEVLQDTLEGATHALAVQEKRFKELKEQEERERKLVKEEQKRRPKPGLRKEAAPRP